MRYQIIVAHPGKQHSFRLASALKKVGSLHKYVTTIYNKESSILMRLLKVFLSKDNSKRANNRRNTDLSDNDVQQFCEYNGLLEAFLYRVDKSHNLYERIRVFDSNLFGKKLAILSKEHKVDAVICYDSNATRCFHLLKKDCPQIKRIMDVSIAARPYMKAIYQTEIEQSGHDDLRKENEYMWNESLMKPMVQEINDTQYFLAASNFVKDSLVYCGVKPERIRIVPYGANVESNIVRKEIPAGNKIEFLFVGQVMYRKGISYLIDAMDSFDQNIANLTITGAYNESDWFVKKGKALPHVNFTGLVTLDKMKAIYEKAHVFVLPSFAEGMAQVGIEAMACGLPIILSLIHI